MRSTNPKRSAARRPGLSERQRGYVAILTLFLAIPLFVMCAFAADVGYWYSKTARLQRSVDSAALAGVIWLPDKSRADTEATAILKENGIDPAATLPDGRLKWTIQIDQPSPERLRVTVTEVSAGRLFSQLSGNNGDVRLIRSSTAEYVRPVPLGSPIGTYGNDVTQPKQPNFWASIAGPFYPKNGGDAYASKCSDITPPAGGPCGTVNSEYKDTGYFYAVGVPAGNMGRTLTVQIYDAGNYAGRPAGFNPGDRGAVRTSFELLDEDQTPLSNEDNPPLPAGSATGPTYTGPVNSWPSASYACWLVLDNGTSAATYQDQWVNLCQVTVTSDEAGIFPLQVKSSNIPGTTDSGDGLNQFSVKASVAGGTGQVQLYALSSMSVFTNPPGVDCSGNNATSVESSFYLAEIPSQNRGKKLTISLFDPGDGPAGNYVLDIVGPDGSGVGGSQVTDPCNASTIVGQIVPTCTYGTRGASTTTASGGCSITTRDSTTGTVYNGVWLDIVVDIPSAYSCTDCWWKIRYRFTGLPLPAQPSDPPTTPTDRFIGQVKISGDPVRVIT